MLSVPKMKLHLALNSCCYPTYNRTRVGSTHMGDTPGYHRNHTGLSAYNGRSWAGAIPVAGGLL